MQEHARQQAAREPESSQAVVDAAPGRASESAELEGPSASPLESGIVSHQRDANGVAEGAPSAVSAAPRSGGAALPGELKHQFEGSLGTNLSDVRVHTGAESTQAASAVGAKAYAVGQDIHFAEGQYEPSTAAGQRLLAHEVAHTVQQRGGTPRQQNKLEVSTPQDGAEHEADQAADAMIAGAPASVTTGAPEKIARDKNDKIVTPMDGPGASVGVGGKLDTTGVAVSTPITLSKPFKGPCCETTAAVVITPSGTLKWPDPTNGKVKFGLGVSGSKGTGATGSTTVDQPTEKEFSLYKKAVADKATEEKEQQRWSDGFEVVDVKLVAGAGVSVGSKKDALEEKTEAGLAGKLKVVAKLKNGTELQGAVNVLSIKAPLKIEGPKLSGQIQSPPAAVKWDLGKGWSFAGSITVAGTLEIKPDYAQLAQQFSTMVAQAGIAGCIEGAAIVAVTVAPLLVMASAMSMVEDETKLFHFTYAEAKEGKEALTALAWGTALRDAPPMRTARARDAYQKGREAAAKAMAERGVGEAEYKGMFEQEKWRFDQLFHRCWHEGLSAFTGLIRGKAATVYKKSWSLRIWKDESQFLTKWDTTAGKAWNSHQSNA
jgi:hypothetical protein